LHLNLVQKSKGHGFDSTLAWRLKQNILHLFGDKFFLRMLM